MPINTEKYTPGSGQGLAWGTATVASVLNSLPSGSSVLGSVAIANGTPLDVFADVSVILGSITPTSGALLGLGIYPLNQDAASYGDGRFTSQASGQFSANYFVGFIGVNPSATSVQEGALTGIILPPGTFKFIFYNATGVTLAGSGNSAWYRTYNRLVTP